MDKRYLQLRDYTGLLIDILSEPSQENRIEILNTITERFRIPLQLDIYDFVELINSKMTKEDQVTIDIDDFVDYELTTNSMATIAEFALYHKNKAYNRQ